MSQNLPYVPKQMAEEHKVKFSKVIECMSLSTGNMFIYFQMRRLLHQ